MPLDHSGFVAVDTLAPEDVHAAFMAAFADYFAGPFHIAFADWPNFLARQGVDLALSRAALVDGRIAALALAAPRTGVRRWRLGGMGALPAARGTGAAAALLDDFIARAGAAGCVAVELECFEGNERAMRLYRGRGFLTRHVLNGWSWPADRPAGEPASTPVREVERSDAMDWLDDVALRVQDLPLQVTAASLRGSPRPLQAWRAGEAQGMFVPLGDAADAPLMVYSLVDLQPGQPGAQALGCALVVRHPGRPVTVPALQRDDVGGDGLARAGFERAALHQVLMVRELQEG